MLIYHGKSVVGMHSKRQLKELVLYSPQHIACLEKAGRVPKRPQLGSNRVRWVDAKMLDWLEVCLARREGLTGAS